MPVVKESEKRDVKGIKKDFPIQETDLKSESKIIIQAINKEELEGVKRTLNWVIKSSRLDGGKDKKNFTFSSSFLQPNALIIEGNIKEVFDIFYGNFVSNVTHENLLKELKNFSEEEKENTKLFK